MTVADRTLAFARSIGKDWKDTQEMDLSAFQRRYLYLQSLGAAHSARAYWILHRAQQHNECHMIARNLLERIFNSRVAIKSSKHAVELIASELSDRIHRLQLWQRDTPGLPAQLTDLIERHERELHEFLKMLNTSIAPQWDYYRRASEANIAWAYRGLYSDFSRYTHAGYDTTRPQELNKAWSVTDFIALLAPIDTALQLHRLSCSESPCKVAADYAALYEEILNITLSERISNES
jgi:hypothetical protein